MGQFERSGGCKYSYYERYRPHSNFNLRKRNQIYLHPNKMTNSKFRQDKKYNYNYYPYHRDNRSRRHFMSKPRFKRTNPIIHKKYWNSNKKFNAPKPNYHNDRNEKFFRDGDGQGDYIATVVMKSIIKPLNFTTTIRFQN